MRPGADESRPSEARYAAYRQARCRSAHPHDVLLLQHGKLRAGQLGHDDELHWQLPLSHTRLFVHACPHEPQLLLLVDSLTHAPLQFV